MTHRALNDKYIAAQKNAQKNEDNWKCQGFNPFPFQSGEKAAGIGEKITG
jgi:hypothetical protein